MKFLSALTVLLLLGLVQGCTPKEESQPPVTTPPEASHPGQAYYEQYCGICHALPDPMELDKTTWRDYVLVRMAAYMGIYFDNNQYYDTVPAQWLEPGIGGKKMLAEGIYPAKPLLTRKEFEDLRDYVLKSAPDKTYGPSGIVPVPMDLTGFKVRPVKLDTFQPFVSALHIDTTNHELYAGLFKQPLFRLDPQGNILESAGEWTMPVQIERTARGIEVIELGSMGGSDLPRGGFQVASNLKNLDRKRTKIAMDSLMRPVQRRWADLDGDGDEDLVIAEFGYHFGKLAWWESQGQDWIEHRLYDDDGTVAIDVRDYNGDELPDILALQANSDERLMLYLNQGNGNFQQKQLERFSPAAGSANMEVTDFDGDGRPEILIAQGDNGDYPPILKKWHGLRLFSLDEQMNLKELAYLPMNGAYGTRSRDFDQDGDLDIAAVSFYPNYQGRPEESFIYFEQTGKLEFKAHTFPQVNLSRWMVLDAGDLDGDGDEDIVLGGFNVKSGDASEATYQQWMNNYIPLVILENTVR